MVHFTNIVKHGRGPSDERKVCKGLPVAQFSGVHVVWVLVWVPCCFASYLAFRVTTSMPRTSR